MSGGPVSVAELQRAWRAVCAGDFAGTARPVTTAGGWAPGEPVLPVVGAAPGSGATTLALALASAASGPSRVVECASGAAGGLVAASTAELGVVAGWVRGRRDTVLIDRAGARLGPQTPPPDPPEPLALSVLDAGTDPAHLVGESGWIATTIATAPTVVVSTVATVPGLRRLEAQLAGVLPAERVVVAVLGPRRRRWPRPVRHALGPLSRRVDDAGRLIVIPTDPGLHARGVDATELPPALARAAAEVLHLSACGKPPADIEGS